MSEIWSERERRTNRLTRRIADYLLVQRSVSPDQIYGLCKLTWITDNYSSVDAPYIWSTKIPALGDIFDRDYSDSTLKQVAADVSTILGSSAVADLVLSHTGFTNFYKAYRNSAGEWIAANFSLLLPLVKAAYSLTTDQEGLALARSMETLPGVPKANHEEQLMRPEYLLTPLFFALDQRIRFPLINGNKGVKNLLAALHVKNASLTSQYSSMIGLYGKGGIADAADLDQVGGDLPDFTEISGASPTKQLLQQKPTDGTELPLKDESDIESLQQSRQLVHKRLHNRLTNMLKQHLSDFTLLEGCSNAAQFDTLVKDYNGDKDDLLIEVKSSAEPAQLRMAIGQLFAYWFRLKGETEPHLAVLLPSAPDTQLKRLLEWLDIGILWFSRDALETSTDWLNHLTYDA